MQIPSGEGEEMVNSLLVTQGNCNSPSHGLAVVVKKIIPTTRGFATCGRNYTVPSLPPEGITSMSRMDYDSIFRNVLFTIVIMF